MKPLNQITIRQPQKEIELSGEDVFNAVQRLESNLPRQTDAHIESCLQEVFKNKLVIEKQSEFSNDGYKDVIISMPRPRGLTEGQINNTRKILKLAVQPGTSQRINSELNNLALTSKNFEGADRTNLAARIKVYTRDLSDLPADAVIAAINSDWLEFPVLPELKAKAACFASERSTMLRIVSTWKPWSKDDEIADLKSRLERATFDSKYFAVDGPQKHTKRAEKAKEAIPRIEKLLVELTGEEIDRRTDEEIKLAHDKLKDDAEKLKELEAQAQRDKIEQFIKDSKARVSDHEKDKAATAAEINEGDENV